MTVWRAHAQPGTEDLTPAQPRIEVTRRRRGGAVLGALLLIGLAMCPGASARSLGVTPAGLAALDPGARSGANTVVVTGIGATVFGVPGRANFIAALGSHETIVGGAGRDELGARGADVTIRAGSGNATIYGGPGGTLVGGTGRNLLVDDKAGAAVLVRGSGTEVVVSGRNDRVLCAAGVRNILIYRGVTATIGATCRADHARVLAAAKVLTSQAPQAPANVSAVTGDGSNGNPFTAPCDDPQNVDCTVSAFPQRTLSGAWANEYVPSYGCPVDHPYLLDHGYSPSFTSWGVGVEIQEDDGAFPIGISITGQKLLHSPFANVFGATLTGYPNSSATNWLWGGTHWYKVVLHCTSDKCHSTDLVGPPLGCGSGGTADRAKAARVATPAGLGLGLAARLAGRDPGSRLGGTTIVVAGPEAQVFAVPHRPNFVMALGSHETVFADGSGTDWAGALGRGVTLRAGNGNDQFYGGPGGTLIGGSGHDQLVDTKGNATVSVRGSGNEVVVWGRNDRVLCAPGARNIVVYRGATDTIDSTCRADHARVGSDAGLRAPGLAQLAAASTIVGDGSSANPYQAPCDQFSKDSCTVNAFPARSLSGLWANEYVPAYLCPDDHPYLYYKGYAPLGTTIPHGVEIQEDWGTPWPIGISITATVKPAGTGLIARAYGTATGPGNSSATNWTTGDHTYKVILHCTSYANLATIF
jgi:hypothetical protein